MSVQASPRRRLSGRGRYSINGGFAASNGAVVRWKQTVTATPNRVTLGSVHVSASLPGTGSMVVAVHEVRQFCATNKTCPFGLKTTTDRVAFPAAFTHVTVSSPLWFRTGAGTLLSGMREADHDPAAVQADGPHPRSLGLPGADPHGLTGRARKLLPWMPARSACSTPAWAA